MGTPSLEHKFSETMRTNIRILKHPSNPRMIFPEPVRRITRPSDEPTWPSSEFHRKAKGTIQLQREFVANVSIYGSTRLAPDKQPTNHSRQPCHNDILARSSLSCHMMQVKDCPEAHQAHTNIQTRSNNHSSLLWALSSADLISGRVHVAAAAQQGQRDMTFDDSPGLVRCASFDPTSRYLSGTIYL